MLSLIDLDDDEDRIEPTKEEREFVMHFISLVFERSVEIVNSKRGEDDSIHESSGSSVEMTREEMGQETALPHTSQKKESSAFRKDSTLTRERKSTLRDSDISLTLEKCAKNDEDNESDGSGEASQLLPRGISIDLPGIASSLKRRISAALREGISRHLPGGSTTDAEPTAASSTAEARDLTPYMGFITYGKKNTLGEHILYLDPFKAPQKSDFTNQQVYERLLDSLLTFTENFMERNVKSDNFLLVYRCLDVSHTKMMTFRWMGNFYHYLRDRYLEKLQKVIIYKPDMKLKILIKVLSPFMSGEFTQKIRIITNPLALAKEQCLPEMVQNVR